MKPIIERQTMGFGGRLYPSDDHSMHYGNQNFFRKGNLIALREMALRRTADRVDGQMLAYRCDLLAAPVWQTRDALLACVGPQAGAEKVVRSTSRLAVQLEVPWHAVYVETLKLQRLPEVQRRAILKTLKLAQDLGAVTATLPAEDIATAIVSYARKHNLAKLFIGRTSQRDWWPFRHPLTRRIGTLAWDIDLAAVARDAEASRVKVTGVPEDRSEPGRSAGLAMVGHCSSARSPRCWHSPPAPALPRTGQYRHALSARGSDCNGPLWPGTGLPRRRGQRGHV